MTPLVAPDTLQLEAVEAKALIEEFLGPSPGASLAARAIVEAEQMDEPRFGLAMLEGLDQPATPPTVETLGPSQARVAATGVFGPLAVATGVRLGARLASATGLAFVTVADLGRLGRLASYAVWAAGQGLVAVIAVDAPPAVVPHGGDKEVLGTNPVAYAIPGSPPMVADFATSDMTRAQANAVGREGPLLPRGGLIGTLVGLLVETLTGAVDGRYPDYNGRTAAILLVKPRDEGATASFVFNLESSLRAAGAQPPGSGRHTLLEESRPIRMPADLHRTLSHPRRS